MQILPGHLIGRVRAGVGKKMKLHSTLITACGVLVIPVVLFSAYKLVTADYAGRPDRSDLEKEFSRIHAVMDGSTEYIDKPALRGVSASFPVKNLHSRELLTRFESVANANNWKRVQSTSVLAKYCKQRLSLTLEVVDDVASPYAEYGISWTADEASFLYCDHQRGRR